MKALVEYLSRALVDNPEPVEVYEVGTPDDAIFRLKVSREDLGKVIGKKGRTAKALRTLLAAAGAKQNMKVTLEILEPNGSAAGDSEGATADGSNGSATDAQTDDASDA